MAKLIKVDGSIEDYPFEGKYLSLNEIQGAVGGFFEIVRVPDPSVMLLVNEEGLILNLPLNHQASQLAGQQIVGPVLLVGIDEID